MSNNTDNSKTQNQNAGDSEVTGIEFFTQAQIYDKFHFYLNYTFLDPRIMLKNKDKIENRASKPDESNMDLNKEINKQVLQRLSVIYKYAEIFELNKKDIIFNTRQKSLKYAASYIYLRELISKKYYIFNIKYNVKKNIKVFFFLIKFFH